MTRHRINDDPWLPPDYQDGSYEANETTEEDDDEQDAGSECE